MRRITVVSILVPVGLAFAAACGDEPAPASDHGERRVVVRDAPAADPAPATADGVAVGPDEAAPEIVILPDPKPKRKARVVHETVYVDAPDRPAPKGEEADLTGAGSRLPTPRPEGSDTVVLPAGRTEVQVQAATAISTDASRVGDPVSATVTEPVVVDGEVVIPEGSDVQGRVTKVDPGEYPTRRPSMEVVYDKIETPDGRSIPIEARSRGEVGTVTQHPRGDHERMRNILLGAGAGAAVGGARGGGRGAVLGAIAGAAIGGGIGHGGVDWCSSVRPGDPSTIVFDRDAVVHRGGVIMNWAER